MLFFSVKGMGDIATSWETTDAIVLCLRDVGYCHRLGDDRGYFPLFKGCGILSQARRRQMLFFSVEGMGDIATG